MQDNMKITGNLRNEVVGLTLIECVSIQAGYPFRGSIQDQVDGDVKVVQPKDISDLGELNTTRLISTTLTGKREADWLESGDILFSAKGTKNLACYVKNTLDMTTCSPSLFLLRVRTKYKDKVNPEFIAWSLNQEPVQNYFKRSAEGSMQVSIRRAVLEGAPIALPDINTQNTIVKLNQAKIREIKLLQKLIQNAEQELDFIATDLLEKSKQQVEG